MDCMGWMLEALSRAVASRLTTTLRTEAILLHLSLASNFPYSCAQAKGLRTPSSRSLPFAGSLSPRLLVLRPPVASFQADHMCLPLRKAAEGLSRFGLGAI